MKNWFFLILMALGMALPACSMVNDPGSNASAPHGSITNTSAGAQNPATVNKGTMVKMNIATPWAAPAAKPGAGSGNGEYDKVLAASQSFTVTVTAADITTPITGSANMSGSTTTVSLTVPIGLSRTFTVKAWDTAGGVGNEISSGSMTSNVIPGVNTIAVTLGAIPVSISGAPVMAMQVGAGIQPTVQLTAKDADGNAILGGINWTVTGSPGNGTINGSGLYTSPATIPTSPVTAVTVNAASTIDTTSTAITVSFSLTDQATVTLPFTKGWQVSSLVPWSAWAFSNVKGIATDGTNLYVTDSGNHIIRKVVISTGAVTTIAGAAGTPGSTDGTLAAARFNSPAGIMMDYYGNLLVADSGNHTIRKVDILNDAVTTIAGTAGTSGSTNGTSWTTAQFNSPTDITMVPGDVWFYYVTDSGNHTIRKLNVQYTTVSDLAGSAGTSGLTDATGSAAQFSSPQGITTDGTNLYVADKGNNAIRKVVIATGVVSTLAGSATSGLTDATGSAARFSSPQGITTDGANLYVADAANYAIRQVAIATGVVTTIAGGSWGYSDGTGSTAQFYGPGGITLDSLGNLYVTDTFSIRKMQ